MKTDSLRDSRLTKEIFEYVFLRSRHSIIHPEKWKRNSPADSVLEYAISCFHQLTDARISTYFMIKAIDHKIWIVGNGAINHTREMQ